MEHTAACVITARPEVFILRLCEATARSALRSYLPPTAPAVKWAGFRQSPALESVGFRRRGSRSLQLKSSFADGISGGKDLSLGIFHYGRVHSHRGSIRLESGVRVDNLSKSLLDYRTASVAGLRIVEKPRRKSNSLVLTTEDIPDDRKNTEGTELGLASQKGVVLPEKARDASRRLCVAVDVDEVLGSFLASLNVFIEETYSEHHDISEYYIYDFMKIWKCSQMEANHRVHTFFDSDHFKYGISPIPGAHQTLLQLGAYCQLVVVTSRQHVIRDRTLEWIDLYYAGIFKEVHFGNHFALEGPRRSKSEICRCLGANVLIDDNPGYAIDCAENGIEVLLFDLNGAYPWSKTPCGPQHPLITRVRDWREVEQALLARSCADL